MEYQIEVLQKEQWKLHIIPIGYTTNDYYDVERERTEDGFVIRVSKKQFESPVTHTPEEYDFPDKLFEEFHPNAVAWGVIVEGELVAAIEAEPEEWSNRVRVNELWVADAYQKQGIGRKLMETVINYAIAENRRAIMLETQSCNVNAVEFYLHMGFTLSGLDTFCYANNDMERKEVRFEMGMVLTR